MQVLFEGSEESPGVEGLGVVPGMVTRFDPAATPGAVPHMGWNGIALTERAAGDAVLAPAAARHVYYTHSYHATPTDGAADFPTARDAYTPCPPSVVSTTSVLISDGLRPSKRNGV